jgi:hypothetical protein
MSDFQRLTAKEKLALERYELNSHLRRRFKLSRLAARSSLRLIRVFTRNLDASRSHDAAGLALFAQRAAPEYERLARLNGAIRYAHDLALRTLRATGIRLPR